MEHLPAVPSGSVHGLETVPYVCEKSYDGGPFLTYPIRENRPEIVPDAANVGKKFLWQYEELQPTPNKEFEAFCQTWLFFGLINELLGNSCNSADFVQAGKIGDCRIISTSRLPMLIEQWISSVQNGPSTMTYEHVAKCLRLTHTTLLAAGPEFDPSVKFCIASVGELFEYAANKAFRIENLVLDNRCPASWPILFGEATWVDRFGKSGWCPSQIEIMVRSTKSLQSMYFFASMHNSVSAGRHGLCDNLKCVAYQTNLKDYHTQHVNEACRCKELCIDATILDAVVTTGSLALLRIREEKTLDELTVEIVASRPGFEYLALSHVWADGLGNINRNALPRCQLLYLRKLTQALRAKLSPDNPEAELLFWCDTLCCPATPGEGKNRVLAQMKYVYEQAACVLVLDSSLRAYERKVMSSEETCARIITSGWMRRLWTLQEGALSDIQGKRRFWFQFRDEPVHLRVLWHEIVNLYNDGWGQGGLAVDILLGISSIRNFLHSADLATLDAAFQHRSVSVSSDEPLLIGTLLGLDVAGILNGSDETRIHRMWSLMPAAVRGIPKSIIFRLGPRLKEEGYRWAPSSMLYYEATNKVIVPTHKGDYQGTPTEHGLMVRLSGYHMSFPPPPSGLPVNPWDFSLGKDLLYMRDDEACWYIAHRRWPSADGDYLSEEQFGITALRCHTNLWITLLEADVQAQADSYQQTNAALLTKLVHESNEVKYVHSYMHIHVFQCRNHFSEMLEAAYRCAQELTESAPAQRLENLSEHKMNMESPEHKTVFDSLGPEILRIAANGENELALTTARQHSGRNDDALFGMFVRMMFIGRYAIMGPRTPDSQQWCVD